MLSRKLPEVSGDARRFKGLNSNVHREFPGNLESSNVSRDNVSREIGRSSSLLLSCLKLALSRLVVLLVVLQIGRSAKGCARRLRNPKTSPVGFLGFKNLGLQGCMVFALEVRRRIRGEPLSPVCSLDFRTPGLR